MKGSEYREYVKSKFRITQSIGFDIKDKELPEVMFPWQKDINRWAGRKGRSALFLDTGLGKSAQELSWSRAVVKRTKKPVLLFTPLSVGPQMCREALKFGITGVDMYDGTGPIPKIAVCNYQKLHRINPNDFGGVVLDESDILRSFDGKTKQLLCDSFANTQYKLSCTATPAPNDVEEIGNQAEFLGVCSRTEMLATYFVHDSGDTNKWRVKGHAEKDFWRWVGTWAMLMRKPSDLGYVGMDYELPPLNIITHEVASQAQDGNLFAVAETTLNGQRAARKSTYDDRLAMTVDIVSGNDQQWLIWCETNDEQNRLAKMLGKDCISIQGADSDERKIQGEQAWRECKVRILLSKCSIFGHGLNWQHCHNMVFVSLSHSFARFYQAVRRCWRFGQVMPVNVNVITSALEAEIYDNVIRKQNDHDAMYQRMIGLTSVVNRSDLGTVANIENPYSPTKRQALPQWLTGSEA